MLYYGDVMVSVAPARRPPASPHQAAARRLNLQPQQGQQPSCCAVLSCVDLRACMIITRLPASLAHCSTTPAAPAPQPEDDRKEHSLLQQDVRYSSWEKITDEKEEQV